MADMACIKNWNSGSAWRFQRTNKKKCSIVKRMDKIVRINPGTAGAAFFRANTVQKQSAESCRAEKRIGQFFVSVVKKCKISVPGILNFFALPIKRYSGMEYSCDNGCSFQYEYRTSADAAVPGSDDLFLYGE